MRAGQDAEAFWRHTPKAIRLVTQAHQENIDAQHKQYAWLAWHVEAFARQKTLPDLSRLMGMEPKAQTDEELWNAVQTWVAQHNAKFALSQQLGEV